MHCVRRHLIGRVKCNAPRDWPGVYWTTEWVEWVEWGRERERGTLDRIPASSTSSGRVRLLLPPRAQPTAQLNRRGERWQRIHEFSLKVGFMGKYGRSSSPTSTFEATTTISTGNFVLLAFLSFLFFLLFSSEANTSRRSLLLLLASSFDLY